MIDEILPKIKNLSPKLEQVTAIMAKTFFKDYKASQNKNQNIIYGFIENINCLQFNNKIKFLPKPFMRDLRLFLEVNRININEPSLRRAIYPTLDIGPLSDATQKDQDIQDDKRKEYPLQKMDTSDIPTPPFSNPNPNHSHHSKTTDHMNEANSKDQTNEKQSQEELYGLTLEESEIIIPKDKELQNIQDKTKPMPQTTHLSLTDMLMADIIAKNNKPQRTAAGQLIGNDIDFSRMPILDTEIERIKKNIESEKAKHAQIIQKNYSITTAFTQKEQAMHSLDKIIDETINESRRIAAADEIAKIKEDQTKIKQLRELTLNGRTIRDEVTLSQAIRAIDTMTNLTEELAIEEAHLVIHTEAKNNTPKTPKKSTKSLEAQKIGVRKRQKKTDRNSSIQKDKLLSTNKTNKTKTGPKINPKFG